MYLYRVPGSFDSRCLQALMCIPVSRIQTHGGIYSCPYVYTCVSYTDTRVYLCHACRHTCIRISGIPIDVNTYVRYTYTCVKDVHRNAEVRKVRYKASEIPDYILCDLNVVVENEV